MMILRGAPPPPHVDSGPDLREPAARRTPPAAGTWQACQAERQRQQAALSPSTATPRAPGPPRRTETNPEWRRASTPPAPETAPPAPPPATQVGADTARQGGSDADRERAPGSVAEAAGGPATPTQAALAPDTLAAEIAARAPEQELFELLLPDGRQLGVLLCPGADRMLRVLLSSSDVPLRRQLEAQKMELEQALGRRMGQATCVTVL